MNSYFRKRHEKRKLKKLASECAGWCGGSYYDKNQGRYVRFWKSNGRKSLWAISKRFARRRNRLYAKKYGVVTKNADDLWWNVW